MKFCVSCGRVAPTGKYVRVFSIETKAGRIDTPDACLCKYCIGGGHSSFRLIYPNISEE